LVGDHLTAVIIFPRSELDWANRDKKHFPDYFELHMVLSSISLIVSKTLMSIDLDGDWSSEDNPTDISDTDDEDEWYKL